MRAHSQPTIRVVPPGELLKELEARAAAPPWRPRRPDQARGRRRRLTRSFAAFGAGALALASTGVLMAAITTVDIRVATEDDYDVGTTDEGATVEFIGQGSAFGVDFGASGSGLYNSFVQVQNDPQEHGYNTDGNEEFDAKDSPTFNHSILVSDIPVVQCQAADPSFTGETGTLCWELYNDLNEANSTKLISLDTVEIFLTTEGTAVPGDGDGPNLVGYPFSGNTTKVYDSDDMVLINDTNSGSGRGDIRYLVPIDSLSIPANCNYGNAACTTYFVLYSQWGFSDDDDFNTDATFEEWKVAKYPFVAVEKTAIPTFTRTFDWDIEKTVSPDSWAIFDGDSGTSDYDVTLTKTGSVDSAWGVSGAITVTNTSEQDAVVGSVSDVINNFAGSITLDCGTLPVTLDPDDELVCDYSATGLSGDETLNTATVQLDGAGSFQDTASFAFTNPTSLVDDTVTVTDTVKGQLATGVSADDEYPYSTTFDCPDDEGTNPNTVTVTGDDSGLDLDEDSASVTVTCYDLDVTKTAVETFSRDFDWSIDKTVDPETIDLFDGDSADADWTVTWTKSAAQDAGYAVSGSITVDNNHPTLGAVINSLSDVITPAINATVVCTGVTFPHTIPASGSLVCTYSSSLPDATTRTNTATATQQNHDYASDLTATANGTTNYQDTESVDFTGVTPTVTDNTATLGDARPGNTIDGDVVSASGSTSWSETFTCGDDEGSHTNTATITDTVSPGAGPHSDDATTTVNCYELTVTKDAETSLDRDFDWTIEKTRVIVDSEDDGDSLPGTLTLSPDQTYELTYEITVDVSGHTDSNWAVAGTITVNNPAPIAADDVVVTDTISGGIGAPDSLDCDDVTAGEQTTVDIPANSSVECTYSAALPDATDLENTATATLFGIGYDGSADIEFATADVTEIDECITVRDDNGTPLNTADDVTLGGACADDTLPKTLDHTITVGPLGLEGCGTTNFINTASYTTDDDANDTTESGSDTFTVVIDVPCPEGCTLTLGYWKTHNATFPGGAPEDPNWFLIGDVDGDGTSEGEKELFFGTGKTWYQIFWTNVAGRPYYQLAHQWMAAYLNRLTILADGGTIPASVQTALTQGAALLDLHDANPDVKGKNAAAIRAQFVALAGTLGAFNEGTIGPGHCDEDGTSG